MSSIKIPSSVMIISGTSFIGCDKDKLVILCYVGSEACWYAEEMGYKYKLLTEEEKSTIKLDKSSVTLTPDKNITLTATVSPDGTKVTWETSDSSVATVSSTGVVTAKKAGTAVITATTADGVKATCKVTVMKVTESIKLNKSAVTLNPSKKITLTATVSPKGTKVTWKSSKTSVATVSSKGVITAKKAGTALITATTSDGAKATCKVTVMNAPKSIKLNKTKVTIKKGKTFVLKYTIPKNTYTTVKYSTSNKKIATVSSKGVIKAVKKGTAVITVKTDNGKVAKCKVTVK